MQANKVKDAITIVARTILPDGVTVLETACADYDTFRTLPRVIDCDGYVYGLTGFNSDQGYAYYRDDARTAVRI